MDINTGSKSDRLYMEMAKVEAMKAYALKEVPIGALIVYKGEVIGKGYNRRNTDKSTLAHAEIIAMEQAMKVIDDWRLEETTMYVTLEPCPMCAGAIVQARIPKVVMATMNPKAGCAGSVLNILEEPGFNHQVEVIQGVLEEECKDMMQSFFKELRDDKKVEKEKLKRLESLKLREAIRASYNNAVEHRKRKDILPWKEKELQKFLHELESINTDKSGINNTYKSGINKTDKKTTSKVLDLGAGSGIYAQYFTEEGLDMTCIDISESMVKMCLDKGLNAKVMDFYSLDFGEEYFDGVWSMNTLLHVPKKELHIVLEQVYKVLKDDGVFHMVIYGGESSEGIWEEDFYEPKRFFARYKDNELRRYLKPYFIVEDFEVLPFKGENYTVQCLMLKKRV